MGDMPPGVFASYLCQWTTVSGFAELERTNPEAVELDRPDDELDICGDSLAIASHHPCDLSIRVDLGG